MTYQYLQKLMKYVTLSREMFFDQVQIVLVARCVYLLTKAKDFFTFIKRSILPLKCLQFIIKQIFMFGKQPQQEKEVCPFNPNHIFAKEKLVFHMNRCKDMKKVIHLYSVCKYNGMHYVKHQKLQQHEQICPDKHEVETTMAMLRRNYVETVRERQRSREKRKREEREKDQEDQEQTTLSECQECMEALRSIEFEKYPKLKKYLSKYQSIKKEQNR